MSDPTEMASSRKRKDPSAAEPSKPTPEPAADNRLLAGYLAHEFLTHGTLLGQRIVPAHGPIGEEEQGRTYADVAMLLKTDGAHISGVINPTHLARWLQTPARNLSLSCD